MTWDSINVVAILVGLFMAILAYKSNGDKHHCFGALSSMFLMGDESNLQLIQPRWRMKKSEDG